MTRTWTEAHYIKITAEEKAIHPLAKGVLVMCNTDGAFIFEYGERMCVTGKREARKIADELGAKARF